MRLDDSQIIEALINRDEAVTHDFFFVWCRPLLYSIIRRIFSVDVDYDELVNELYIHLMENDARRLRTFQGRSSVYQWLKCVAIRFFIEKRDQIVEDPAEEPLYSGKDLSYTPQERDEAKADIKAMISLVKNEKYRYVLEQYYLNDVEFEKIALALDTSLANVYNIKRRALTKLTVLLLDNSGYEKA